MSHRVLVVEPDGSGCALLSLLLKNAGRAPLGVKSIRDARAELDRSAFELVFVDELAGNGSPLEEVRWLRVHHPTLPVVVTGAVLTLRVMLELLRLRVADVLPKPFAPDDVRASLARIAEAATPRHAESVEFAAAIELAREALEEGSLRVSRTALSRAQSIDGLDAEAMALAARLAELEGDVDLASRAYRAAIALRDSEDVLSPDPYEALARIEAEARTRRGVPER